ncbi:unnamed protein product [Urochloa humidicola]
MDGCFWCLSSIASGPRAARPCAFSGAGHLVRGVARGGGCGSETRRVGGSGVRAHVGPQSSARKLPQAAAF